MGLIAAVAMAAFNVHPAAKLALFLPFSLAGLAFFQGSYKVCPGHVAKGQRETQDGELVRVCNPKELERMRSTSRRVIRHGMMMGAAATALVMLFT